MCEPTSIMAIGAVVGGALSATSAVVQADGQREASEDNAEQAEQAYREERRAFTLRQMQEMAAAGADVYALQRQARQLQATEAVSAGEAGVAGASVEALMAAVQADTDSAVLDVQSNLDATLTQLGAEKRGARARRDSRKASVQGPNDIATGLRIGRSALDAASGLAGGLR